MLSTYIISHTSSICVVINGNRIDWHNYLCELKLDRLIYVIGESGRKENSTTYFIVWKSITNSKSAHQSIYQTNHRVIQHTILGVGKKEGGRERERTVQFG